MSFAGFFTLDSSLVSRILVVNSSGTPINADALPTFRVYGPNGFVVDGTVALADSGLVSDASNAAPIVITSSAHGLSTGARVTITGVAGNTAANGTFVITKITSSTFSLDGSTGNGQWTSGGTWNVTGLYQYTISLAGTDGFEAGESYQALFVYAVAATNMGQWTAWVVN
jgi:hypothetical protein